MIEFFIQYWLFVAVYGMVDKAQAKPQIFENWRMAS